MDLTSTLELGKYGEGVFSDGGEETECFGLTKVDIISIHFYFLNLRESFFCEERCLNFKLQPSSLSFCCNLLIEFIQINLS